MYDVIVVGAGPAGCTASKALAEKGYKVLLVEKFKMPRYKSCSGVLIKKSMELVKTYFGEDVPESAMCTPTDNRGMIFTNDKGKEYRFEQDGFVEVSLHGKNNYTEGARYVLDCEGVAGTLKRQIARQYAGKITGEVPGYITTFQTFNEGSIDLDSHYFYAYLQPELSEYDAWFNVKDDLLVLGVSVKDMDKIGYYYERFVAYMEEKQHLRINRQTRSEKWLMPHIRPGCHIDYGVGRVFFAGEVAGFLNPMGEGISAGMESGYCATCAIMEHFDNPQMAYEAYQQSTENLKSYMQRQWSLVGGMADTFREME
ncbi:MAG: NAD(P)/FAD-dependent oxidoreductase [Lachnospiraceae bacterium]|nr:NAD(P)/FAD-dependent oxidoreductase [Lachnospiraceae bacterium]